MSIHCPNSKRLLLNPVWRTSEDDVQFESRYLTYFEQIKKLGIGGFGSVYEARHKLDETIYAVKRIILRELDEPFDKPQREILALARLNHPNVVRYYQPWLERSLARPESSNASTDDSGQSDQGSSEGNEQDRKLSTCLYIQMEYCPKPLVDFLKEKEFSISEAWRVFKQLVDGLAHIHAEGIIHRDLARNNIFMDNKGNVKIGDFGLARFLEDNADALCGTGSVGQEFYRAPEVAQRGAKITTKADIYSLGVIFFELFYRFDTEWERVIVLKKLKVQQLSEWTFPQYASLLFRLMSVEPDHRPSAAELLWEQPWKVFGFQMEAGAADGNKLHDDSV